MIKNKIYAVSWLSAVQYNHAIETNICIQVDLVSIDNYLRMSSEITQTKNINKSIKRLCWSHEPAYIFFNYFKLFGRKHLCYYLEQCHCSFEIKPVDFMIGKCVL